MPINHTLRTKLIFAILASFVFNSNALAGGILFVDDDAAAGGDGLTWDTAYRFLQDALTDAAGSGISEIHVAQGTYKPDRDEANPDGTGDREATFHLLNSVALLGGYAGLGAKDPDARHITSNATILSGDLIGNDVFLFFLNYEENSYHVVNGSGADEAAMIEGFFIRSGNADDHGGGFYCENGTPSVTFCGFEFNMAHEGGGAMYMLSSNLAIVDCTFTLNITSGSSGGNTGGGAVNNELSTTAFIRCDFNSNSTPTKGGAIVLAGFTTILDCTFTNNTSGASGGAIRQGGGSMEIQGSSFISNESTSAGGALIITTNAVAIINDCEFITNTANSERGGGVFLIGSEVTISNSLFDGNMTSSQGGGVHNEGSSLLMFDCDFLFNNANNQGGGLAIKDINDETFVINCNFYSNSAVNRGGAIYNLNCDLIINCVFSENESPLGGAFYNGAGSIPIVNCTFFGNSADDGGGLYIGPSTSPEILNCVIWGNNSNSGTNSIFAEGDSSVMFSTIEGGWPGNGNIDSNPMFVDTGNGDYRLSSGSPCIDAGHNWGVPVDANDYDGDGVLCELFPVDLDGNPRFNADEADFDPGCGVPVVVDMGAFEYQFDPVEQITFADLNGDNAVNTSDLLALFADWGDCDKGCCLADLDLDGLVNTTDLLILFANWGACK